MCHCRQTSNKKRPEDFRDVFSDQARATLTADGPFFTVNNFKCHRIADFEIGILNALQFFGVEKRSRPFPLPLPRQHRINY